MVQAAFQRAPKEVTGTLGVIGGLAGAGVASGGHGFLGLVAPVILAGAPVWLVDTWWRSRKRRREEQVLPQLERS